MAPLAQIEHRWDQTSFVLVCLVTKPPWRDIKPLPWAPYLNLGKEHVLYFSFRELDCLTLSCFCVFVYVVLGKIRSAVGSAQLLMSQKFQQFRELCEENLVRLKHASTSQSQHSSISWPCPLSTASSGIDIIQINMSKFRYVTHSKRTDVLCINFVSSDRTQTPTRGPCLRIWLDSGICCSCLLRTSVWSLMSCTSWKPTTGDFWILLRERYKRFIINPDVLHAQIWLRIPHSAWYI